ncbi:MAG: hypothetical protein JWL59_1768 [Chthoniobacteraceae bacterium]|nr:hypothetical protein [Chthoniobacteraceae bacterium]
MRCHNLRDVFVGGRVYFVDADCYSRMTRARSVAEHPGSVVRHHDFENFPQGIDSHVTAPMDYLIVAGKWAADCTLRIADPAGTSVLRGQELDLSGAFISPLLGMMTCAFLGIWARRGNGLPGAGAVPLLFAISPILVHGTVLGRPDHQSLLIFLLAVALGAESRLSFNLTRRWAIVGGLAWAMALWVSFYEPLVLLSAVALAWAVCAPKKLLTAERGAWLIAFGLLSAIAFGIEGWRIHPVDPALLVYFTNWSSTIGELGHPSFGELLRWLGFGIVAAPVLLVLAGRHDRRAWPVLALLLMAVGLACWQLRWGYFLALLFVMTLPMQLAVLRRRWVIWTWVGILLWPIAQEWDAQLFSESDTRMEQQRLEPVLLRQIAGNMRGDGTQSFLAPWWISPAVAYWSGVPGVAGSAHEGISGIADSARVYLAPTPEAAAPILRARRVRWIIADEAAREIDTSRVILGVPAPERAFASLLLEPSGPDAPFLHRAFANDFFKLFSVDDSKLPQ